MQSSSAGFYSLSASSRTRGKESDDCLISPSGSTTSVNTVVDDEGSSTSVPVGLRQPKRTMSLPTIHFSKSRSRLWPLFALATAVIIVSLSSHLDRELLVRFHSSVPLERTKMSVQTFHKLFLFTSDLYGSSSCDPYSVPGILRVNLTHPSEIVFSPILRTDCVATDLITPLRDAASGKMNTSDVDYVRNRTVVLLGDSVDR